MRRTGFLALTLFALAAPPLSAQGTVVTVQVDGVQRRVPLVERQGRRFVLLEEIAGLLGGTVAQVSGEQAVLEVDDQRMVVQRRIPFVEHGGRWYQMTDAAQKDGTGFYLPASSLDLLLPALWPGRFQGTMPGVTPPPAELPSDDAPPARERSGMIGAVDFRIDPGRTRLDFHMARTPGVEVDATTPRTLRLRLTGATLPPAIGEGLTRVGLVDSARVAMQGEATELTLWLDSAATVFAVAPLRAPARGGPAGLEVILIDAPIDAAASLLEDDVELAGYRVPPPEPRRSSGTRARPEPRSREAERSREPETNAREWVVVVDAGHGGHDPGAHGPDGTREKDVTLAIALALREELRDIPGIRVVLTRDDDTFIPLGGRTRLANDAGADLFVSIHANSAERASAEGFETYFLSAAVTEDARRVANMENSAIRYENRAIDPSSLDDVNFILWDLAQNEYLRESSALAEAVQVELERRLPLKSRGVKQAPFYVLKGAYMPAILFETAFISNPREEALLNDSAFQTRLAGGLAESLVAFLDRYGRKTGGGMAAR